MVRADMAKLGSHGDYGRYGWMILSANTFLGICAALITGLPSLSLHVLEPIFVWRLSDPWSLGHGACGLQHPRAGGRPDPIPQVRALGLVRAMDVAPAVALAVRLLAGPRLPDARSTHHRWSSPSVPDVLPAR